MSRNGKTKHPVLQALLPLPAGLALGFILAVLTWKLPDGISLFMLGIAFAAGIGLWVWAVKRKDRGHIEIFSLAFSFVSMIGLGVTVKRISEPVNLVRTPLLFWGVAIALGFLGGGLCLWLIDLEWRYNSDYRRKFVWIALLITGFAVIYSFCFGVQLLFCVGRLMNPAAEQTAAAVVVEAEEISSSFGKATIVSYYGTVTETELTAQGERLCLSRETYEALEPGDQVKVILYSGILGASWLECVPLDG